MPTMKEFQAAFELRGSDEVSHLRQSAMRSADLR